MSWRPLRSAARSTPPKLASLARASRHGFGVPETWWLPASAEAPTKAPPSLKGPWILRSASPHEDGTTTSSAGQFESVIASTAEELPGAFRRVAASMPAGDGAAVFVQELLTPELGGVAFFDGFHLERSEAPGGNRQLTEGTLRGDVRREHVRRGDAFHDWLLRLYRTFGQSTGSFGTGAAIDVEYARDGERFTLLQVRPALFEVRRNPTLSLANHKEILGDPPSPWIVSVLERAGEEAFDFFGQVDPAVRTWKERYCQVALGRAWIDFAAFFRLMDHWGLPRTFVTAGIGGEGAEGSGGAAADPADERVILGRFLRSSPRLVLLQLRNAWTVLRSGSIIRRAAKRLEEAEGIQGLHEAGVHLLDVILRVNFAINGALAGILRVRSFLRIRGSARIVTRVMMEEYDALRRLPESERDAGLARWLENHGHRGPLESDPWRPRFRELAELLREDLAQDVEAAEAMATASEPQPSRPTAWLLRPFFWLDERRESFRDDLMRVWARWRERLLVEARDQAAAGWLADPEDLFFLTGSDLDLPASWRAVAADRRAEHARMEQLSPPTTATLERIESLASGIPDAWEDPRAKDQTTGRPREFQGMALGPRSFEGEVTRARDLPSLLAEVHAGRARLDSGTVLVVPALEPSWAVVFGRVGAVLAEIGGELSHASILLREAAKPAIVGASGCFGGLEDGERVRLEGSSGRVSRLAPPPVEANPDPTTPRMS